jgi:L-lactate dehydrogenase complex protein LldG
MIAVETLAKQQDNETRRTMLAAIRTQLTASAPHDAVRLEHAAHHTSPSTLSNAVGIASEETGWPLEGFRASLEAVGAHCMVVDDQAAAATTVKRILEQTRAQQIAISDSPLVSSVIGQIESGVVTLQNADASALFDCDVGITGAQWAIAETGTLVLESDRERHRLTSLVPAVHIALIEANRIRQTLGEVLKAISEQEPDALSRTVTFITGPSRTSDIELTLAIGVHGPAELHVIVIEDATP